MSDVPSLICRGVPPYSINWLQANFNKSFEPIYLVTIYKVVSYARHATRGALRNEPKNGCVEDYI